MFPIDTTVKFRSVGGSGQVIVIEIDTAASTEKSKRGRCPRVTTASATAALGRIGVAAIVLVSLAGAPAFAQTNASWKAAPGSNDFNTAANWSPATIPTGTATFGASSTTSLTFSADTTLGGWSFATGAPNYSFTNSNQLVFNGAGIVANGGGVAVTNLNSIAFINSSTAGSAVFNNAATLAFLNFANAGTATINSTFLVDFSVNSSASGATINVSGGVGAVQFRDNATAAAATITAGSGATAFFADQASGGSSRVILNTGGALDISLMTAPAGVAIGSLEGSGTANLGGSILTVGGNGRSTTFSGVLQDGGINASTNGALVKVGAGTLVLSGLNTFTGGTTVNGGVLAVTGTIGADTVNAGGTLMGTGSVGASQINAGGIFAPGSGVAGSSIIVNGSLALQSGAVYLVQANAGGASFATVATTAALGGVVQVAASGIRTRQTYDILRSGGLGGTTFSGVQSLTAGILPTLTYSGTDVFLTLNAQLAGVAGLNGNQRNVAASLDNVFNAGGSLPASFASLFGQSGAALGSALTQASGEIGTSSQQTTYDAMSLFMGLLTDPFMQRTGSAGGPGSTSPFADDDASGYAARGRTDAFAMFTKAPPPPFVPRWSVWGAGFGGSQSTSGNAVAGSNDTTSSIYGTAVGADYSFSPNTLAGFALAGGGTRFGVNGLGSGRSDLFQAGAYVRHTEGPAYISAALAYGWQDITTDRVLTIAGVDHLRAEFNANAYSGRVEGGYRFVAPWNGGLGLTPYAAAQATTFDLPAYAEQVISGAGAFALGYAAKNATDTRTELGLRTDKSFAMAGGVLILRGRLAWAHDFDPARSIAASFQALPGASFVVNGAAQDSDSALTTASAEIRWMNGWSAAATFEGEFSEVTRSYAGKAVLRYLW